MAMQYLHKVDIVDCKHHHDGTWFMIRVPDWFAEIEKIPKEAELRLNDGRSISVKQRMFIYALFGDIRKATGQPINQIKETLKTYFVEEFECKPFSLSDVDMTTAREFIEHTLSFMFEYDIPLSPKVHALAKEVNNYLYLCLIHRKCAACGKKADIHHVDAVGMGRDRTKIDHTKHRLIALCSKKCHKEAHDIGWITFKEKHHVDGIKVNQETVKKLEYRSDKNVYH